MSTRATEELVHAALDGELDEAGQAKLDSLLAESAAARTLHTDMQALRNLLDRVPDVEPPPDLHAQILAGIAPRDTGAPAPGSPVGSAGISYRMAAGLAVAFVAGALVSAGVYEAGLRSAETLDPAQLVGTMISPETGRTIGRQQIAGTEISGEITQTRTGSILLTEFRLSASGPFQLDVRPSSPAMAFRGFARRDQSTMLREAGTELIRLEGENQGHFSVAVEVAKDKAAAAQLGFSIRVNGRLAYEGILDAVQ